MLLFGKLHPMSIPSTFVNTGKSSHYTATRKSAQEKGKQMLMMLSLIRRIERKLGHNTHLKHDSLKTLCLHRCQIFSRKKEQQFSLPSLAVLLLVHQPWSCSLMVPAAYFSFP